MGSTPSPPTIPRFNPGMICAVAAFKLLFKQHQHDLLCLTPQFAVKKGEIKIIRIIDSCMAITDIVGNNGMHNGFVHNRYIDNG
jgi:hypothetical protein